MIPSSNGLPRTMAPSLVTLSQVKEPVALVYSAHPYTSSERGINEVYNRMVNRDFSKGGDSFDATKIADKLTNMRRR